MTAHIRLGVIGTGKAYEALYRPALMRSSRFVVAATADPRGGAFKTPEAMLEAGGLDGVIVLSPPALHAAHAGLVLDHGLRVLVEKPPALTVDEVERWARPELVTPAFSRRYWKGYHAPFGPGRRFHFVLQTDPSAWGAQQGEPPERDLLPHAADLARWLSSEEVTGYKSVVRGAARVSGVFDLESGGSFDWWVGYGTEYLELLSCDGRQMPAPGIGRFEELVRRVRRAPTGAVAAIVELLNDWALAFDGKAPSRLATSADALACARVIEAVEAVPSGGQP